MKKIIILILATTGLFSCKQGSKSTPDTVGTETLDSTRALLVVRDIINLQAI